jgi:dCMP deaminase
MKIPSGERYELCRAVHAEANAIIHATYTDMIGSTLYLCGVDAISNVPLPVSEPCAMCKRMILNAQIKRVVSRNNNTGTIVSTDVHDFIIYDYDNLCINKVDESQQLPRTYDMDTLLKGIDR